MLPGMSVDVARTLHTEGSSTQAVNDRSFPLAWPQQSSGPDQVELSGALRRPVDNTYTQRIHRSCASRAGQNETGLYLEFSSRKPEVLARNRT